LLLIIHSLHVLIYLKTFSQFFQNPIISPRADYESNSVRR